MNIGATTQFIVGFCNIGMGLHAIVMSRGMGSQKMRSVTLWLSGVLVGSGAILLIIGASGFFE